MVPSQRSYLILHVRESRHIRGDKLAWHKELAPATVSQSGKQSRIGSETPKNALLVRKPQNKMITMPRNFTKSVVWSGNAVSLADLKPHDRCTAYHFLKAGYLFRKVNGGTEGQWMDSSLLRFQRTGQGIAENTPEEVKTGLQETVCQRIRR